MYCACAGSEGLIPANCINCLQNCFECTILIVSDKELTDDNPKTPHAAFSLGGDGNVSEQTPHFVRHKETNVLPRATGAAIKE